MANDQSERLKELWVAWTHDAIRRYVPPEDIDSTEALVDDMIAVSVEYASGMLDEYEETFGIEGSGRRSDRQRSERRGRRRKGDPSGGDGD